MRKRDMTILLDHCGDQTKGLGISARISQVIHRLFSLPAARFFSAHVEALRKRSRQSYGLSPKIKAAAGLLEKTLLMMEQSRFQKPALPYKLHCAW